MTLPTSIRSSRFHIPPVCQGPGVLAGLQDGTQSSSPRPKCALDEAKFSGVHGPVQSLFCSQELPRASSPCQMEGTHLTTSIPAVLALQWTSPTRPWAEICSTVVPSWVICEEHFCSVAPFPDKRGVH